ncbi:MAG TPA: 2,3,4,5-tetrahydropyridine-2,6-dicarboxylate N-succinyltransferase, partial [Burkholderiaceae bacterium]|nr:2,3,4,5-tetrahydropyridine-2,6-dicarboxylate N-succinyltransferase [Burkholderiaceae bacterium]
MSIENVIEQAWPERASLTASTAPSALHNAVEEALAELDSGRLRVAEKIDGAWVVHQWLKKAVLLSFRLRDNIVMGGGETDPLR